MVEDGDVVKIHYIGREQATGEIFDLTEEAVAEEEGHDTEELDLGPMHVLIGAQHVIDGLEDAIRNMDEGDEQTVDVAAEDAFGERNSDSIETFPRREFEEYDITPQRGLVVEVDGRRGKVISTSSGRVRVDFNHPLAGKDLEYEVEILDVLDDPEDRVDAVLGFYGLDEDDIDVDTAYDADSGDLTVTLPQELQNPELTGRLQEELSMVNGVESVEIAVAEPDADAVENDEATGADDQE